MKTTKKPDEPPQAKNAVAQAAAHGERRSRDRVADDEGTGTGSATALSKLKMIERKKALVPRRDRPITPFG